MANDVLARWANLSDDDRARLAYPIIQMIAHNNKPWKANWNSMDADELELLINTILEARSIKLGILE